MYGRTSAHVCEVQFALEEAELFANKAAIEKDIELKKVRCGYLAISVPLNSYMSLLRRGNERHYVWNVPLRNRSKL